jgi:acetylornithine/succinyldiaminopimelate/putrescine aminotransferase
MNTTIQTSPGAADLLVAKQQHIWPCVYHFYRDPPVIVRGAGAWMFDSDGKRYLDCFSGVGVMNAGHGNQQILSAAIEQMQSLCHTTTIYLTQPVLELANRLAKLLPGELETCFFCASGSEAIEAAMLLATLKTKREQFVSFKNSLHGRTKAAMSATELPMWRTDRTPLDSCRHAPHFSDPDCLSVVERMLSERDVAAVLIEPVQGNGGIHVPPDGFLQSLQAICHKYGTLLIADEIQTGFNRTGYWLASTGMGVTPDIVTIAKGLGNGFPIAAAVTTTEIAAAYSRPGASTFGGNPVSAAAALATLRYHEQHDLGSQAIELGQFLLALLRRRIGDQSWVGEIRGRGLMVGVELKVDTDERSEAVASLLESMKDAGFLLGRTGPDRNVITIMPPLVVQREQLVDLVETLEQQLTTQDQ